VNLELVSRYLGGFCLVALSLSCQAAAQATGPSQVTSNAELSYQFYYEPCHPLLRKAPDVNHTKKTALVMIQDETCQSPLRFGCPSEASAVDSMEALTGNLYLSLK
jgi:hypothetical protein